MFSFTLVLKTRFIPYMFAACLFPRLPHSFLFNSTDHTDLLCVPWMWWVLKVFVAFSFLSGNNFINERWTEVCRKETEAKLPFRTTLLRELSAHGNRQPWFGPEGHSPFVQCQFLTLTGEWRMNTPHTTWPSLHARIQGLDTRKVINQVCLGAGGGRRTLQVMQGYSKPANQLSKWRHSQGAWPEVRERASLPLEDL